MKRSARIAHEVLERVIGSEANVLCELARVRVPDLLERGSLTAAEIAERTGTDADAMARTKKLDPQ